MPVPGTTVARRQLGRWLRSLRDAAGKTEADVEESNLASRTKLWRIETGRVAAKVGDVRGLCWLYEVDPVVTGTLSTLAAGGMHPGWWQDHRAFRAAGLDFYAELEGIAGEVRIYDPELVHAILQTPDYSAALQLQVEPQVSGAEIQRHLASLRERQRLLRASEPLRLIAVLGAGVLIRPVGSREVMADQIRHLCELNRQDNVDIRILPWHVGAHPAMPVGAFTVMDFRNADDPPVVQIDTLTGARYQERPCELEEYRRVFRQIYSQATSVERIECDGARLR